MGAESKSRSGTRIPRCGLDGKAGADDEWSKAR